MSAGVVGVGERRQLAELRPGDGPRRAEAEVHPLREREREVERGEHVRRVQTRALHRVEPQVEEVAGRDGLLGPLDAGAGEDAEPRQDLGVHHRVAREDPVRRVVVVGAEGGVAELEALGADGFRREHLVRREGPHRFRDAPDGDEPEPAGVRRPVPEVRRDAEGERRRLPHRRERDPHVQAARDPDLVHVLVKDAPALDEVLPEEPPIGDPPIEHLARVGLVALRVRVGSAPPHLGAAKRVHAVLAGELGADQRMREVADPQVPLVGVGVEVEPLEDPRLVVREAVEHRVEGDSVVLSQLEAEVEEAAEGDGVGGSGAHEVDHGLGPAGRGQRPLDLAIAVGEAGRMTDRAQDGEPSPADLEVSAEGEAEAVVHGQATRLRAPCPGERFSDPLEVRARQAPERDIPGQRGGERPRTVLEPEEVPPASCVA